MKQKQGASRESREARGAKQESEHGAALTTCVVVGIVIRTETAKAAALLLVAVGAEAPEAERHGAVYAADARVRIFS